MYGIELQELAELNASVNPAKISAGQVLRLPPRAPARIVPTPETDEEFTWPLKGVVIEGGGANPNAGAGGISIAPSRSETVLASRSGKVVFYNEAFLDLGKTLIIEHPGGFWTVYGRNSEVFVKVGDSVSRGSPIAKTGRAGRDPQVYLYFEIRKGHISQNPGFYLSR